MDTSPNTHPNVVDETTDSHVNIDDKEIELLIIASIETLKRTFMNVFFKSRRSLTIVHLFGCAIVARITIKSINFMKGI